MSEPMPKKLVSARFRAALIPLLAPWQGAGWTNPYLCGVQVEPSPGGGVDLVATNSVGILWIHEPEAHGRANEPFFLDLPRELVRACREPKRPRLIDVNHDTPSYELPGWLRPGYVDVFGMPRDEDDTSLLVCVGTAGPLPEDVAERFIDGAGRYSATQRSLRRDLIPWRPYFEEYSTRPTEEVLLDPQYLGRLKRLAQWARRAGTPASIVRLAGSRDAMRVDLSGPDGASAHVLVAPMVPLDARQTKIPRPVSRHEATPAQQPLADPPLAPAE